MRYVSAQGKYVERDMRVFGRIVFPGKKLHRCPEVHCHIIGIWPRCGPGVRVARSSTYPRVQLEIQICGGSALELCPITVKTMRRTYNVPSARN